jgi:hypothetical protein
LVTENPSAKAQELFNRIGRTINMISPNEAPEDCPEIDAFLMNLVELAYLTGDLQTPPKFWKNVGKNNSSLASRTYIDESGLLVLKE